MTGIQTTMEASRHTLWRWLKMLGQMTRIQAIDQVHLHAGDDEEDGIR